MPHITSREQFDALTKEGTAILLKHGATCPISAAAREELAEFANLHGDVPIYDIEVTGNREVSEYAADRLGVEHESPQAFVLRDGKPVWHAEHYDITVNALEERTRAD